MTLTNKLGIVAALAISMSSCSLFTPLGNVVRGDAGVASEEMPPAPAPVEAQLPEEATETVSIVTDDSTPAPMPTKDISVSNAGTKSQAKGNKSKKTDKTDKKSEPSVTHTSPSQLEGRLNGEWTIIEAGKHKIEQDEDMPYIYFDEANHKFYASNGCNIINGAFSLPGGDHIAFSNSLSTMRACPDIDYPDAISEALRSPSLTMQFKQSGKETLAFLFSKTGQKLVTLRRHNMELLNGNWAVTEIEGKKIDNDEITIFLDIPELSIHGNTGCNYFNGKILIEPSQSNSISFSQMGVTKRMCPDIEVEMAMLVALEQTHSYSLSDTVLKLYNDSGKHIMTLKHLKN